MASVEHKNSWVFRFYDAIQGPINMEDYYNISLTHFWAMRKALEKAQHWNTLYMAWFFDIRIMALKNEYMQRLLARFNWLCPQKVIFSFDQDDCRNSGMIFPLPRGKITSLISLVHPSAGWSSGRLQARWP